MGDDVYSVSPKFLSPLFLTLILSFKYLNLTFAKCQNCDIKKSNCSEKSSSPNVFKFHNHAEQLTMTKHSTQKCTLISMTNHLSLTAVGGEGGVPVLPPFTKQSGYVQGHLRPQATGTPSAEHLSIFLYLEKCAMCDTLTIRRMENES